MTVNTQIIEGNWKEIKGMIREKWGDVTDNDLEQAKGNLHQLVGLIQRKTGESGEAIEAQLERFTSESLDLLTRASAGVRHAASQTGQTVQAASQKVADAVTSAGEEAAKQVQAGYTQTKRVVAKRPMESMAVVFGAGLVTGVVAGLLIRSR